MTDLAIVAEGETEEGFVIRVLAPALWTQDIYAWAVLPGQGQTRRGGRWPWDSVRRDVKRLLQERTDRYCAILFDYYALPHDWPGRIDAPRNPIGQRARVVEEALVDDITHHLGDNFQRQRFVPHIQLHEYESRLFSDCTALGGVLGIGTHHLEEIVTQCGTPETIDDNVNTAPSKRLDRLCREHTRRGYRKTTDGVTAAERVTLASMRGACPHFSAWMARIEAVTGNVNPVQTER